MRRIERAARLLAGCAALLVAALAAGCGTDSDAGPALAGTYVLDRIAYVEAEVAGTAPRRGAAQDLAKLRQATRERARKEAAGMEVQLTLAPDGSYVVRFRFGKERGADRGAWRLRGEHLLLSPRPRPGAGGGAPPTIEAVRGPDGIRFSGWPVPRPFLLRPR